MSHRATNWAFQQRGLKPAAKVVLLYLADRHNPDYGCFPSQEQLAVDAEMSISALNEHLRKLEEDGLIRRERRVDPQTKQRKSTRYILGFESDFPQEPTPESGDGNPPEPSPDSAQSHLRNPETNPVREPVRGGGGSARARAREDDPPSPPANPPRAEHEQVLLAAGIDPSKDTSGKWFSSGQQWIVKRWRDLGLSHAEILTVIGETVNGHPPSSLAYFDEPMRRFAGRKLAPPLEPIRLANLPPRSGAVVFSDERIRRVIERLEREQNR